MNAPAVQVLIVEDEAIIAAALSVRLRGLGYTVTATASSYERALQSAVDLPPDVVLMDIQLRGSRSGIEAAQRIQESLGIPVVFTTAYADAETIEQAKLTEPYGYLLKPFDDSSLKVAVELAVYRRRSERERQTLERQLLQSQKMESVGRLAGGIAHDFNNLLAIIYGISEMIQLRPEATQRLLPDLQHAVDRGAALIRRLLLFSRPEAPRLADIDVGAALSSLRKLLQRLMGADVRLIVASPAEPLHARLDPLQLDQLVMNLAVNARDAMPGGGEVVIGLSAPSADWLELSVQDSGVGISAEHIDRIFEPFFSTKAPDEGTGLGLSVVRRIVQGFGGEVSVTSEIGAGSTFRVRLPRAQGVLPEAVVLAPTPAVERPGRRILVVDDDEPVREILALMLRSAGHEVAVAAGVGEAIAAMSAPGLPTELLLTDVMMPYIRGPELAAALCRVHPGLRVGYISGFAGDLDAHPLLSKPFRRDTLLQFVDRLLAAPPEGAPAP